MLLLEGGGGVSGVTADYLFTSLLSTSCLTTYLEGGEGA